MKSQTLFSGWKLISLQGKTNFFEKRVSEYAKSGVSTNENTLEHHTLRFDDDDDFQKDDEKY